MLHTFFWGDFARAVNEETINYPLMASYYPSASILDNQMSIPITIVLADKIYTDYSNLNDVESDTLQYCRHIFNIMNKSKRWQLLGRVESCSVTKFIESNADICAGHIMTVNFMLRDSNSICDLPMSGYDFDQEIGSSCLPVQIYRNGVLVDTVESGGMYQYTTDAFTYTIKNTDLDTLYSGTVTSNLAVTIQDANVTNSDFSYSSDVVAEGSLTLPDVVINVKNSLGTTLNTATSPSVLDVDIESPDITFTDSDGNSSVVPAGVDIVASACSLPTYATADVMKTGQTVSYVDYDDGYYEDGRTTDSLTLNETIANIINSSNALLIGNYNRFTDTAFGQTYTNKIALDWSTFNGTSIIGYYTLLLDDNTSWTLAQSLAHGKTFDSKNDWRVVNRNVLSNLINEGVATSVLNYAPFNITTNANVWMSTTNPRNTTQARYMSILNGAMDAIAKTTNGPRYMIYRRYTLAELGL
jgi:hypothetical protein